MLIFRSYESPSRIPAEVENFTLSKTPLNPSDVVYSDERTLCVRIKEKTVRCYGPIYFLALSKLK